MFQYRDSSVLPDYFVFILVVFVALRLSLYILTFMCYCLLHNMISVIFPKFLLFSLVRYSTVLFIRNPFLAYFYSF